MAYFHREVQKIRTAEYLQTEQESRADAGVSTRQSRHLAINCEFGFLNSDSNSLTCAATWQKR